MQPGFGPARRRRPVFHCGAVVQFAVGVLDPDGRCTAATALWPMALKYQHRTRVGKLNFKQQAPLTRSHGRVDTFVVAQ